MSHADPITAEQASVVDGLFRLNLLLSRGRYRLGDEKLCQLDMADWLSKHDIPHVREYILDDGRGNVDFFLPRSGLAIEVKVSKAWQKLAVFRQCERYCSDPQIKGILLATASAQGLPSIISGKPAKVMLLSQTIF